MVRYFKTAAAFRAWLEIHHASRADLWVGFFKKHSGRGGMTYLEAVDQALCFGWIDGLVKRVDDLRYAQRFTPRTSRSHWSATNLRRAAALRDSGQMAPSGLSAFSAHAGGAAPYSYEQPPAEFTPPFARRFEAESPAWQYFTSQPPGYRRTATFWVMSAKKIETRERRLTRLIADSAAGRRLALLAPASTARARQETRIRP